MMKLKRLILSALLVISTPVFCAQTEIMWVKFQVNRIYKDADKNCFGTTAQGQLLFSAELVDGVVIAAQLQNFPQVFPYTPIYRALALSVDEIKSIKLYQDTRGEWWVTQLELSEPSFRWALFESAYRYSFCATPQPLDTVTPKGFTFEFETEGLKEGIWISESNKTSVSGSRKDGQKYSGSIQLTQKEFRDGL